MSDNDDTCLWTEDEDGIFDASCGGRFEFTDGTPSDNDMLYCCYCGKILAQQLFKIESEAE